MNQQARIEHHQQVEEDDFKFLLSTVQGRRFLWDLLEFTGIYRTTYRPNSESAFLEGQRNVGLKIMNQIHKYSPESYITMLKEAKLNDNRNFPDSGTE